MDWVINLQPQAFGPLLLALSSAPKAFSVDATEGEQAEDFEVDDAHFLQQRAIERCIGWISQKPDAAQQFEETLICMNRDGVRLEQAGLEYCKNRLHLDLFMSERVKALFGDSDRVREQYRASVYKLGGRLDNFCQHRMLYRGSAVPSTRQFKTEYKGPDID